MDHVTRHEDEDSVIGLGAPSGDDLLIGRVLRHAAETPDATAYRFLFGSGPAGALSYGALMADARAVADGLVAAGCVPGTNVALMCQHGPGFVTGFLGTLMAGCAAVPVARPNTPATRARARAILDEAACAAVVSDATPQDLCEADHLALLSGCKIVRPGDPAPETTHPVWTATAEDVALIQYSSGSTGAPRGVILTHGALAAQQRILTRVLQSQSREVGVTWLPPEHDMGLIGGLLYNLWRGGPTIVLSPASFVRRPILWLEAISTWRGTISVAPNFAYDLCVRAISEARKSALDLSSWSVALNGAEPVRPETMERFAEAFGPAGFDARAFIPCYGLAEATLLVSGVARGMGATSCWFDAQALERGLVLPCPPGQGRRLASSGPVRTSGGARISDPDTGMPCTENAIGEIWIAGDSVGRGYRGRPEESAAIFGAQAADGSGPWLRSGDTGFLWRGELYVTGRIKDIVILHGRTLHAADLERALDAADPRVRKGRIVVHQRADGAVSVIAEVTPLKTDDAEAAAAMADIAKHLWRGLLLQEGVDGAQVSLVRPGALLWTTSGKLRRRATKERLRDEPDLVLLDWSPEAEEMRRAQIRATRQLALAQEHAEMSATAILGFLAEWIAAATGTDPAEVDPDLSWADQGLDSLMITELALDLERATGRSLAVERLFELPDPRSLATELAADTP
ncbi:MAG: AMP-binding protein [Roseovarius sp.]|uniref:AMP-binding protein n=1 Tax=Roseovarius sp. TaxID=1486281 RepID=UPI001B68E629|nr:AMP-binding protein [Roseovarius sp.]MBQ0751392.1 AMP-binding protein [Roseovarius sp.]MBQ0810716.1 AMP-binding protein [Roseovarius sp.]